MVGYLNAEDEARKNRVSLTLLLVCVFFFVDDVDFLLVCFSLNN